MAEQKHSTERQVPFLTGRIAILCLLMGPILLSGFRVGELSLDNYVSLFGLVLGGSALIMFNLGKPQRLVIFAPVSIAISIAVSGFANEIDSVPESTRYVSIAVLATLASLPRYSTFAMRVLRFAVLIGAASVIAEKLSDYSHTKSLFEATDRFGGLMGHPNFGAYLISLVALTILTQKDLRFSTMIELVTLLVALLSTGAIAATLTFAALAGIILLTKLSLKRWLVAVFALPLVALFGSSLLWRLSGAENLLQVDSFVWRIQHWNFLLGAAEGHRLFGIGWQQSMLLGSGFAAHSAYIQVIVELGVFGFALIAASWLAFLVMSRGSLALFLPLVFSAIVSITDPALLYPSTLSALVVILAAGHAPRKTQVLAAKTESYSEGCITDELSFRNQEWRTQ